MTYKDPEKKKQYQREYQRAWKQRNPEKSKEYLQKHRKSEKGRERAKLYQRKRRAEKPEEHRAIKRRHYYANRDRILREKRQKLEQLRIEVLSHYGNGKCACVICGESRLPCLSVDHINGGGHQQMMKINKKYGLAFYQWLKKNNLPEGYQTLCMNCQFIKSHERKEMGYKPC